MVCRTRRNSTDCGPALGRGAVWLDEPVQEAQPSDAFLFGGFAERGVHLVHDAEHAGHVSIRSGRCTETERGRRWMRSLLDRTAIAGTLSQTTGQGEWIRVTASDDCRATVWFEYRAAERREPYRRRNGPPRPSECFVGTRAGRVTAAAWAASCAPVIGRQVCRFWPRRSTRLAVANRATTRSRPICRWCVSSRLPEPEQIGRRAWRFPRASCGSMGTRFSIADDDGTRYRLPIGNPVYRQRPELLDLQRTSPRGDDGTGPVSMCRDVLSNCRRATPADSPGFDPMATHPVLHPGLLFVARFARDDRYGVPSDEAANSHIVRSADGVVCCLAGCRGRPLDSSASRSGAAARGPIRACGRTNPPIRTCVPDTTTRRCY